MWRSEQRTNRLSPFRAPPLADRIAELRRLARSRRWEGLDSDHVADLLTDDWLGAGPLRLDETLTLDELAGAVLLHNVRGLLLATRERGVVPEAPTGSGSRMPTEQHSSFEPLGFMREVRTGFDSVLGPVVDPLHWTQALAEVAGLVVRTPGGFALTLEGERLAASGQAGELYARLFRTFFRSFDLAYTDRFPGLAEIQDLVPYWLWVMAGARGAAFLSADFYVHIFTPEPGRLDEAAAPARLRYLIQARVLDALADFGLLEPKLGDDEREELGDVGFRPTPLFGRFLRFELPPPVPGLQRGHLSLLR
jgi:hypothetical protein